jgi:hypothetical protein
VYFKNGGVFSVTTVLPDGTSVEAAAIGDEGMLGIEAFLSDDAVAPGAPMTYSRDGKQYIVVATGFKGVPGELIALALP